MNQSLGLITLVVRDCDEAIAFYVGTLGFELLADTYIPAQDKRWVVVAPPGSTESRLLLARASTAEQLARVGDQTGGRVALFLHTDDLARDHRAYQAKGVRFVREPRQEPYGAVAVFADLYGNLWDLLQPVPAARPAPAAPSPQVGVGVLVIESGRVLLGRRKGSHGAGTWSAPGGHLEFGETIAACARREVLEETGLHIGALRAGPYINTVFEAEGRHYVTAFVLAVHASGTLRTLEPDKCEGWAWFDWADLPEPLFAPLAALRDQGFRPE